MPRCWLRSAVVVMHRCMAAGQGCEHICAVHVPYNSTPLADSVGCSRECRARLRKACLLSREYRCGDCASTPQSTNVSSNTDQPCGLISFARGRDRTQGFMYSSSGSAGSVTVKVTASGLPELAYGCAHYLRKYDTMIRICLSAASCCTRALVLCLRSCVAPRCCVAPTLLCSDRTVPRKRRNIRLCV